MPFSLKPTSAFTIETSIDEGGGNIYTVDQMVSQNLYTASPGPITESSIEPVNTKANI
jgi:hypothetical protein